MMCSRLKGLDRLWAATTDRPPGACRRQGLMAPDLTLHSTAASSHDGSSAGARGRRPLVRQPRVLLVDEDRLLREAVATGLQFSGWRVTAAGSANEALAAFQPANASADASPDLICLDLLHPLDEETRFMEAVRSMDPDVPIIGLTAMTSDERWAEEQGITALLSKPFSLQQLKTLLAAHT